MIYELRRHEDLRSTKTHMHSNFPALFVCTAHALVDISLSSVNAFRFVKNKPVARQFNTANHSISDIKVCAISPISCGNDNRRRHEKRLIFKIGTIHPHGLFLFSTVAHNCHGNTKSNTAKPNPSRQNQIHHGKTKSN